MNKEINQYDVLLYVESRYKVNRKRVRTVVRKVLAEQDVHGSTEVSIAVVGDRKMRELSRKYKNEDKTRNILSFSLHEGESTHLPADRLLLGDIVLSYPEIIRESAKLNMMVDDRVDELVEHGLMHLMGLHHE